MTLALPVSDGPVDATSKGGSIVRGWRRLVARNPRPLRPERAEGVVISINGCHGVLGGRRVGCPGGTS